MQMVTRVPVLFSADERKSWNALDGRRTEPLCEGRGSPDCGPRYDALSDGDAH